MEIQGHFKYLGSITQGNGGQDREIQSRINAASQVFRSLKKSVFTSNHVDLNSKLHFYSCLVLSRLMYGAAESWALTGSQAAQLEAFHNSCMRRMMGRYRGTGGPSTAELLDGTGQMPISQLLSRHRVRWLGHAARKPETTIVNQLLHADYIPGRPRPVGRPHYTWMDGAMQDLNTLGPGYRWTSSETGRSWRSTGSCGGGLPAGASLVGAYRHQPT